MQSYVLPEPVRNYASKQLRNLEDEKEHVFSKLCASLGLSKTSLNPHQALELYLCWLLWHETKHLDSKHENDVLKYVMRDLKGNLVKDTPLAKYHLTRSRIKEEFPVLEYNQFNRNWTYSDHVKQLYPLLDQLMERPRLKLLKRVLKTEEDKKLFWFWLLSPSYQGKPEICPIMGVMTKSLSEKLEELENGGVTKILLIRELYSMIRYD